MGMKTLEEVAVDAMNFDRERLELERKLSSLRARRREVEVRRSKIIELSIHKQNLWSEIQKQRNMMSYQLSAEKERLHALEAESLRLSSALERSMQINVLNDAFYIWFAGPFATINNFRLGTLPSHPVDWTEINAAFGQAALVVHTVALKCDFEFKEYNIRPQGSFAKLVRVGDTSKTLLNLYTDGTFSLFPKKNFNAALIGFLHCVNELGEHIMSRDPTLQLPYMIDIKNNTICGNSILLNISDEMGWTRTLKHLLANIKWIIAWAAKHYFDSGSSIHIK